MQELFKIEDPYVVITADIVNSKTIKNRWDVQETLKTTLNDINSKYASNIKIDFRIILGDEIQGALNSGLDALGIISELEMRMYPVKMRFAASIGQNSEDVDFHNPFSDCNSLFCRSRKTVDGMKVKKRMTPSSDITITTEDERDQDLVNMLNTILTLCNSVKSKWTEKQRRLVYAALKHGDNQTELGKLLKIDQSTVQKGLVRADYYNYKAAVNNVSEALQRLK